MFNTNHTCNLVVNDKSFLCTCSLVFLLDFVLYLLCLFVIVFICKRGATFFGLLFLVASPLCCMCMCFFNVFVLLMVNKSD